jgi:hypothetical protein
MFFTHGGDDGDQQVLAFFEVFGDLFTNFVVGELDIILGATIGKHQREETIVNVEKSVFVTDNVGDIHVVSRGREIFILPVIKRKTPV